MGLHHDYVKKLERIGEELGFNTNGVGTELGNLDCIWRLKGIQLPRIEEDLPIVAFEVICSEEQKALRGSFTTMLNAKPSVGIFVLIRDGVRRHGEGMRNTTALQWLSRIEKFIDKIKDNFKGSLKVIKWYEKDIDNLYKRVVEGHDT
jgi:hypothetical protein